MQPRMSELARLQGALDLAGTRHHGGRRRDGPPLGRANGNAPPKPLASVLARGQWLHMVTSPSVDDVLVWFAMVALRHPPAVLVGRADRPPRLGPRRAVCGVQLAAGRVQRAHAA